jgi:carbonic anhydrase
MQLRLLLLVSLVLFNLNFICIGQSIVESDTIFRKLWEGNKRFYSQQAFHPHMDAATIINTSKGQKPMALVLTCSDSRVIPESIFDVGIGDLFVIRLAGNIVESGVLGSIEYAINHLQITHIVVLGHTQCGAIKATTEMNAKEANIIYLLKKIRPAYNKAKLQSGDIVINTSINNVCNSINKIKIDEKNFDAMKKMQLATIGALYHIETGKVEVVNCSLK